MLKIFWKCYKIAILRWTVRFYCFPTRNYFVLIFILDTPYIKGWIQPTVNQRHRKDALPRYRRTALRNWTATVWSFEESTRTRFRNWTATRWTFEESTNFTSKLLITGLKFCAFRVPRMNLRISFQSRETQM